MATISGLYATGEGISDNAEDTHYALTYLSADTYGEQTLGSYGFRQTNGELNPAWVNTWGTGRWITPVQDANAYLKRGNYRWRLSFSIDSSLNDPNSGVVSLRYMSDNQTRIELNGSLVSEYTGEFLGWTTVSDISGFVSGSNYFDFIVNNQDAPFPSDQPTGLVVEFTSNFIGPAVTANAIMFSCNT